MDSAKVDEKLVTILQDDLNTPLAISRLHEMAKEINKCEEADEKQELQKAFKASADVMGFLPKSAQEWFQSDAPSKGGPDAQEIEDLIEKRITARANKDFAESDRIRDYLLEHKITLEDSAQGTIWKRR